MKYALSLIRQRVGDEWPSEDVGMVESWMFGAFGVIAALMTLLLSHMVPFGCVLQGARHVGQFVFRTQA